MLNLNRKFFKLLYLLLAIYVILARSIIADATTIPTLVTVGQPSSASAYYGSQSSFGAFELTGSNLTRPIIITTPANFEVNIDNVTFGPSLSYNLPIAAPSQTQNIYVRLVASLPVGSYSGNIILNSAGAAYISVPAYGTVFAAIPIITTSGSPSNLTTTYATSSTFKASGSNRTANIVINAPAGFKVSLDNINFYNVVTINGSGNVAASQVYIRLKSTDAVGSYSGSIVLTSPGAPIINLVMSPSVVMAVGPLLTTTGTPSPVSTTYGTPSSYTTFTLSGANLTGPVTVTAPAGFEVSTDGITFGPSVSVAAANATSAKTIYIRLTTTASAGTHSGNIDISSTGAADVQVAMPQSTVAPAPFTIYVTGTKTYGGTFTNFTAGPSDVDFSPFESQLKNGELITNIDISFSAGASATDPAGTYNNAIHIANAQGTNGFLPSNYQITYQDGALVVNPAPLTITALDVTKPGGTTLTGGPITSGYTFKGLQNGETITGVTVTYGNGAAANATSGSYTGSVTLSNVTGANGFLLSNYAIKYVPANIIVTAAGAGIVSTGPLAPLTTIYGTYSSAETFNVVATNLTTSGILVTPPTGFEVSTDDANFYPTVTIGAGSTSLNQTIFIRLAKITNAGQYSGNIVMSGGGASNATLAMPVSTVVPAPLTISANAATKTYGIALPSGPGGTEFSITGGSLQNGETISSVTVLYLLGDSVQSPVGSYNSSVNISAPVGPGTFLASNYNITYVVASLTVQPATLSVIANSQSRAYAQPNPVLTFYYNGFVNGENSSVVTSQPTVSTTATQTSAPGQYPIMPSGGAATNYTLVYVNGTLTVTSIPGLAVTIPNTFTPNGDGINDTWNITNLNMYAQSHVQIFNRNGTLVYNSVGYATPWDGTVSGARVPDGTYYYVITLIPGNEPMAGWIAVIR